MGFGFRLGEHADFQILLELGPQRETRPIGGDNNSQNAIFRKRHINLQQELELDQELEKKKIGSSGGNWLEKWYQQVQVNKLIPTKGNEKSVKQQQQQWFIEPLAKTTQNSLNKDSSGKLPEKPILAKDVMKHLHRLYELADSNVNAMEKIIGNKNTSQINYLANNDRLSQQQTLISPLRDNKKSFITGQPEIISEAKTKRKISEELMDVRLDK